MLEIKNKIEFETNLWLGEIDASNFNSSEEARIKTVTDLASITKGRLGFNDTYMKPDVYKGTEEEFNWHRRVRLYNTLLTESAGKPSVLFELVPVSSLLLSTGRYKFQEKDYRYVHNGDYDGFHFHTNLRNAINFRGDQVNGCQFFNRKCKNFKIIIGQAPWKVISHLRTHRAFSFLVESSRNKKYLNEVEFWYPSWWNTSTRSLYAHKDTEKIIDLRNAVELKVFKPEEATMELSDRRLVKFAMCAWKQDTNAWDNLFAVRGEGTGTQSITKIVVDNIKTLIK